MLRKKLCDEGGDLGVLELAVERLLRKRGASSTVFLPLFDKHHCEYKRLVPGGKAVGVGAVRQVARIEAGAVRACAQFFLYETSRLCFPYNRFSCCIFYAQTRHSVHLIFQEARYERRKDIASVFR